MLQIMYPRYTDICGYVMQCCTDDQTRLFFVSAKGIRSHLVNFPNAQRMSHVYIFDEKRSHEPNLWLVHLYSTKKKPLIFCDTKII